MKLFKNLFKPKPHPGPPRPAQWDDYGTVVDSFEIQYLHPDHHGYPAWPGGERHLKLLRTNWGTQVIFTEGLSSVDSESLYEIYIETNEDIDEFSSSWEANIVYAMGRLIPAIPDLNQRLARHTYLTVQIQIDGAPEDWSMQDPEGNIGIFVGLANPHISNFQSTFIPILIKLMRPAETAYAITNGDEGRKQLASLYSKDIKAALSFLDRESVV